MANNKVDTYKVSATYSPAAGTEAGGQQVDSISITASINAIPYAEIGLQPGTEKTTVYQMSDAIQVAEMEALQRFAFSQRSAASVSIQLDNTKTGKPVTSSFYGMPIAPSKSAGFGFVDQKIKLYGTAIFMNAFRPYIYAPLPEDSNAAVPESLGSADSSAPNVMQRAVDLLKARMDMFQDTTVSSGHDEATLAMAKEIHSVNLRVFPSIEVLARDSTEAIYSSFSELQSLPIDQQEMIKASINNQILNNLLTSSGNFFETVTSFLGQFQLYYVPDSTGAGFGKVRPFRTMVQDDFLVTREVDMEYLSMSAEDYDYGPIQQVLVQGIFQSDLANTEQDHQAASSVVPELESNTIIVYPETVSVINGNFRPVGPPIWLPTTLHMFDNTRDKTNVTVTGGWKIAEYQEERKRVDEGIDRVLKTAYYNILKEYTKNIYLQSALASYTCVARVPLDYTWKIGVRYEITSVTGEVLFRGFLTQLNHQLSGIRNNLSAWTTLVFSHVEYGGFKLE